MKIGIMGGTFNPPHNGHLLLAQSALSEAKLDKVLFLPSGTPPHKKAENIVSPRHRINMVSLAIKDNPYFEINTIETDSPEIDYTVNTLKKLHIQYSGADLHFILGADSIMDIHKWYRTEEILKLCGMIYARRPTIDDICLSKEIENLKINYNAQITDISSPLFDISSSDIRNRIKQNKFVKYLLSKEVEDYIRKNNLYKI